MRDFKDFHSLSDVGGHPSEIRHAETSSISQGTVQQRINTDVKLTAVFRCYIPRNCCPLFSYAGWA